MNTLLCSFCMDYAHLHNEITSPISSRNSFKVAHLRLSDSWRSFSFDILVNILDQQTCFGAWVNYKICGNLSKRCYEKK